MTLKKVLHEWRLDMEFNKRNGQLTKEGELGLEAFVKADNSDVYSLSNNELEAIVEIANLILLGEKRTKNEIIASLLEQGVPALKVPGLVEQTLNLRKEAKLIVKALNSMLMERKNGK
ncbi:hypothetical protein JCM30760_26520 [Thiomicrorhabdus hydrogeniphila]